MSTMETPVLINSATTKFSSRREIRAVIENANLLLNLVRRDLTVRYKRSILGVWSMFLNPLLTTGLQPKRLEHPSAVVGTSARRSGGM